MLNLVGTACCLLTTGAMVVLDRTPQEIGTQLAATAFYALATGVMTEFGVVLTPAGITLRGWMTRYYPWDQVKAIEAVNFLWMRRTQVVLTKGTKIRTWAPYDDYLLTDLRFDIKVETMQAWLARHGNKSQNGSAPSGPPSATSVRNRGIPYAPNNGNGTWSYWEAVSQGRR